MFPVLLPTYHSTQVLDITSGDFVASRISDIRVSGDIDNVFFRLHSQRWDAPQAPILVDATNSKTGAVLVSYEQNAFSQINSGWQNSYNYDLINGTPYALSSGAAAIYDRYQTGNLYRIQLKDKQNRATEYDLRINRLFGSPYELVTGLSSNNSAWVSYDVAGEVTTNKVFAYSISLLNDLSGLEGTVLNESLDYPPEFVGYGPQRQTGYCDALSLILATSGHCKSPEPQEEPNGVCLTGEVTTGQLRAAMSGVLAAALRKMRGTIEGVTAPNDMEGVSVASEYDIYTGEFKLNTILSGDRLCFSSYDLNGNYTGTYSGYYDSAPLFPQIDKCWNLYGYDADGLVSAINDDLFLTQYYLWHDYECTRTEASGYYENGPLLVAHKKDNNTVGFTALRMGSAGKYKFTLSKAARLGYKPPVNILKYLLPTTVRLEAADVYGDWSTLDVRSNIDWLSIEPTLIQKNAPLSIESGSAGSEEGDESPTVGAVGSGIRELLYSLTVTGVDKCGKPWSEITEFYQQKIGDCEDLTEEDQEKIDELLGVLTPTTPKKTVVASYLKTGWKFDNVLPFNYYRIVLDNFISSAHGLKTSHTNEFAVANINLYGTVTGHAGFSGEMCLIGADYAAKLEGLTTGILSGQASGYADESTSGVYDFNGMLVRGIPNGDGRVKFQQRSGMATTEFTGVLADIVTGVEYYEENVGGYFYEPSEQAVSFTKPVSGWITGAGYLRGGIYNIVDSGYLMTGIEDTQFVVRTTEFPVSGYIPDVDFPFSGRLGFAYLSGVETQIILSGGCVLVQKQITGAPSVAYQYGATGFRNAVGVLDYNTPSDFDSIIINEIPVWYATGDLYGPPSFYSGIDDLVNIINSGQSEFGVAATREGQRVLLSALTSGSSGNSITLASEGSGTNPIFTYPTMQSGESYFNTMTPSGPFTGFLDTILCATGFYVATASGDITGFVRNLSYVRAFTGVWDLTTGDLSFRDNNWIQGARYTNSSTTFYRTPTYFSLEVSYSNDPVEETVDFALLTISGENFGTGIQLMLSGQQL